MFQSNEDLLQYIATEAVEFVDVRFCDVPGVMQHFTVPATSFNQDLLDAGLMFDGSSIQGFQAIHE
jgi:glutamine synthetase